MSRPDPIAAAIDSMAAHRQRAYVSLIHHTSTCRGCDDHSLCDEGRRLWAIWKGRDR
ncbi:hypothetical protein [Streptomyces sp. NPDC059262]|uniref:hypothetical protein n=1 Tax=Streptomyces sp. NPDC059262 TaxID=3346797 RepID=UPI0036D1CCAB